jgi:hypothetical protein
VTTSPAPVQPPPVEPALSPCPCPGPGAYTHNGYYFRYSGGPGYLVLDGSGPAGNAHLGGVAAATTIAIGGTPSPGLVFAGTITSATLENPDFTGYPAGAAQHGWIASRATFGLLVDWFPDEHRGWHVGGTAGLDVLGLSNNAAGITMGGFGFAAAALGGYDFWIGPEWSLGILGNLGASSRESLKDDHGNDTGYTLGAFWACAEATLLYH